DLLQPLDPPLGRVRCTGFFNSWVDQTDLVFGSHQLRLAHKRRVVGQPCIIVEEEQELTGDMRDPSVAPCRDPEVLWKAQLLDLLGDAFRVPAVADTDDVEFDTLLCQNCFESAVELLQPLSLAEDDDAESVSAVVHDNLLEAMIDMKCPITDNRQRGAITRTSQRSPNSGSAPAGTTIEVIMLDSSAISDISTEWKIEWRGTKGAIGLSVAITPGLSSVASMESASLSSPLNARDTWTMSLSALLRRTKAAKAVPASRSG